MAKSVLLIGLGQFGYHLAKKMKSLKDQILGIDILEERVDQCLPYVTSAQIADATNESVIKSLGVRNFDVCIVTIAENFQASLEATSLLKDFGAKFVVSRASGEVHAKFLLRNGADEIIYPERDTAVHAAVKYSADHVFDFIELTPEYSIYETAIPKGWLGKTLVELQVRSKYRINILAIRIGDYVDPMVSPTHRFAQGESIFILGNNKDLRPFL